MAKEGTGDVRVRAGAHCAHMEAKRVGFSTDFGIIGVWSAKPACGATTLCWALGGELARRDIPVFLIDAGARTEGGDLGFRCGQVEPVPAGVLRRLLQEPAAADWSQALAPAGRHLWVFWAGAQILDFDEAHFAHLFRWIRQRGVGVVEVGGPFDRRAASIGWQADALAVVTEPDVASWFRAAQVFRAWPTLRGSAGLVCNHSRPSGPTEADVPGEMPVPIWGALPWDPDLHAFAQQGLIHKWKPGRSTASSLEQLANQLLLHLRDCRQRAHGEIGGDQQAEDAARGQSAKALLHSKVLSALSHAKLDEVQLADARGRAAVQARVEQILREHLRSEPTLADLPRAQQEGLVMELLDEILGLGPLEGYLRDAEVTEIMVNGASQVYVERNGRLECTGHTFVSDRQVHKIIERIVAPVGRRIDESTPMVDARLPDGSRVNAIIPPLALNGPILTIRKFPAEPLRLPDLVRNGSISSRLADFLAFCVRRKKNLLISGGTGSGKTTLLNVLSGFIPPDERIITIEDAAELRLLQSHVVRLEARPPNIEGRGTVTIRDLVRNALRMRPDRLIIGEVRGAEALDMLQAMNTGHSGSMTTLHANSAADAVSRLETMTLLAGLDLPVRAIREQIAAAIDLIIHQSRSRSGRRGIVDVSEVVGMDGERVALRRLYGRDDVWADDGDAGLSPSDSPAWSEYCRERTNGNWTGLTGVPPVLGISAEKPGLQESQSCA